VQQYGLLVLIKFFHRYCVPFKTMESMVKNHGEDVVPEDYYAGND
jgi:hypothetical protein